MLKGYAGHPCPSYSLARPFCPIVASLSRMPCVSAGPFDLLPRLPVVERGVPGFERSDSRPSRVLLTTMPGAIPPCVSWLQLRHACQALRGMWGMSPRLLKLGPSLFPCFPSAMPTLHSHASLPWRLLKLGPSFIPVPPFRDGFANRTTPTPLFYGSNRTCACIRIRRR